MFSATSQRNRIIKKEMMLFTYLSMFRDKQVTKLFPISTLQSNSRERKKPCAIVIQPYLGSVWEAEI